MARANANNDGGVSKAESIRQVLKEAPAAATKDVVATLAGRGVRVSANHVYLIKSKMKQRRRRQKRERVAEASRKTPAANPIELVARVKGLAREVGGISNLKQLVDLLAE